ncbi:MAG: response regulator [Polyangiaceae bacterium]
MSASSHLSWLARVATALGADDAERALSAALEQLRELGLEQTADSATATFRVEQRGRTLCFRCEAELEPAFREALVPLLALGLLRVHERREQAPARAPLATPVAPRSPACRVLVVDDEVVVRSFLRRSLERRGYIVEEAADGEVALEYLSTHAVDVVVLDMTMPRLDGAEVLKRLRASGSTVKVLLSSGYGEAEVEQAIAPASFQGMLFKPYGIPQLVDAIEQALSAVVSLP